MDMEKRIIKGFEGANDSDLGVSLEELEEMTGVDRRVLGRYLEKMDETEKVFGNRVKLEI